MAVTITDRRTEVINAESNTNWTPASYGLTTTSAEHTNAVAESLAITNAPVYYTQPTGSVNLGTSPGTLVYVWSFNNALQDAWDASPPPNALMLGDGTDRIAFDMAGADKRVFNHLEGPTGLDVNSWQCLVLDTAEASQMNTDGNTYLVNGTFAGLNFGAITQWGCSFDTNSKALGGGYNVAVDIIRYGNDGIRLTAGGIGTEGTCAEIAVADRSRADGAAHGIFRELNPVAYGCQGPMTFGDSGTATDSRFIDSGRAIAFEARNIADDKYYLNVEGHASATNVFELTSCTITTGGPNVKIDMSSSNINSLILSGVTFSLLGAGSTGNTISFPTDYLAATRDHEITNCSFSECGVIDPGSSVFTDNIISAANLTSTEGAVLIDAAADTDNWNRLSFTRGTAGHAIKITQAGTYDFNNFTYSGYSGTSTSATVYNDSGGAVTINVIGGDTPTIRNGTSASTTINNNVTVTVDGVAEGTAVKVIADETVGTVTTGDVLGQGLADSVGEFSFSLNYEGAFGAGLDILIRARNQGVVISALFDNGAFTDETTDANSLTAGDVNLMDFSGSIGDAFYVGGAEEFTQMKLTYTAANNGNTSTLEYWNGSAWTALSGVVGNTYAGNLHLSNPNYMSWTKPTDWAKNTVNSKGPYYYVRNRITTAGSAGTVTASRIAINTTRYLPIPQSGELKRTIMSNGLTVTLQQVEDTISTF